MVICLLITKKYQKNIDEISLIYLWKSNIVTIVISNARKNLMNNNTFVVNG